MSKKLNLLKKYEQYIYNYEYIQKDNNFKKRNISVDQYYKLFYNRTYINNLLMDDVCDENKITEGQNDLISSLRRGNFYDDPYDFLNSYTKTKKISYLTPYLYTIDELKSFSLYKIKGYNIGFAIKKNGEIILVHNNTGIKGVGDLLIQQAIKLGGTQLDHFDGYLTGYYKKNGFKVKNNESFLSDFAPEGWEYEKINIDDPKTSIYPNEIKCKKDEYIMAKDRYSQGEPDIVYRSLI
jgi:hypothetical protein